MLTFLVAQLPLIGRLAASGQPYHLALRLGLLTSLLRMFRRIGGLPDFGRLGIQRGLQQLALGLQYIEAHHALLMLALFFSPGNLQPLAVVPPAILGGYHLVSFLQRYAGNTTWYIQRIKPIQQVMNKVKPGANFANALIPIVVMFKVAVEAIFPRPVEGGISGRLKLLINAWFFLTILRIQYFVPDTQVYARQAWQFVGVKTEPLVHLHPSVKKAVEWTKDWFLSGYPQQTPQQRRN